MNSGLQFLRNKQMYELLIIGGSAGSFPIVSQILEHLPKGFRMPVVLCLHRLKDKRQGFKEALEIKSALPIEEPDDKSRIENGTVYVAPANYHLLVEEKGKFALATTELVQFSRPSIDVLFESAADIYKNHLLSILLSGANRDGAYGMKRIKDKGGLTIVQDPKESNMSIMPEAALNATKIDLIMSVNEMIEFLKLLQ